jgi:hypothetical protein
MPGLYLPFVQRLFSDHDEVGRVAQRDLCDRVGFDDLHRARRPRRALEPLVSFRLFAAALVLISEHAQ